MSAGRRGALTGPQPTPAPATSCDGSGNFGSVYSAQTMRLADDATTSTTTVYRDWRSVKANGRYLIFRPPPLFKITDCDLESSASVLARWNMKSSGKRSILRLAASFRRRVGTP